MGRKRRSCPGGNLEGKGPSPAREIRSLQPIRRRNPGRENSVLKKHIKLNPLFSALHTRPRWKACVNFLTNFPSTARAKEGENFHIFSAVSKCSFKHSDEGIVVPKDLFFQGI